MIHKNSLTRYIRFRIFAILLSPDEYADNSLPYEIVSLLYTRIYYTVSPR